MTKGKTGVEEANARGWKQPYKAQAEDQQQVSAKAVWNNGRWSVVMKRPLLTEDRNDVQFEKGRFIPLAINAWDGSNGEHGRVMSVSSWYNVFLEAPTPVSVYVYTLLAVLIISILGMWLVRKVRGRRCRRLEPSCKIIEENAYEICGNRFLWARGHRIISGQHGISRCCGG